MIKKSLKNDINIIEISIKFNVTICNSKTLINIKINIKKFNNATNCIFYQII